MNILPRTELKALMETEDKVCVSIYLSIPPSGDPARQMQIKLKNALKEADEMIRGKDENEKNSEDILKPLRQMVTETPFMDNLSSALVVFLSSSGARQFWLPIEVSDIVQVSGRFHVKPLIALFSGEEQFYLLTLSQKKVRFFRGSRYALTPLEIEGMPKSMKDALNYEAREKTVQRVAGQGAGGRAGYVHGHGAGYDLSEEDMMKFFRMIDRSLSAYLKKSDMPLLVAAVEEEVALYRKVNTFPGLLEESLKGNFDAMTSHQIHEKAMEVMDPVFRGNEEKAREQYEELAGTEMTASDLEYVIPASTEGRIQTCFVARGSRQWGKFDPETRSVEIHDTRESGDVDLLDLAAYHTLHNGGMVFALPGERVPGDGLVAALLRY